MMSPTFVFLSHNSRDKPAVEALAGALLDRGIRPWLDKWDLTPGRPWQSEIEQALANADAVLVCIGRHGIGRVQQPELQVAQDCAWNDPDRLVIPTLLTTAPEDPEVPDFLRQRTWIDLRAEGMEAGVTRLVAALEGRAQGPGRTVTMSCPYPGLAAFDEEDALAPGLIARFQCAVADGGRHDTRQVRLAALNVPYWFDEGIEHGADWAATIQRDGRAACFED